MPDHILQNLRKGQSFQNVMGEVLLLKPAGDGIFWGGLHQSLTCEIN